MDGARVVTFAVMEPLGIEQLLFVGGEVERLVDVLLNALVGAGAPGRSG
jgi:hypothetical protein